MYSTVRYQQCQQQEVGRQKKQHFSRRHGKKKGGNSYEHFLCGVYSRRRQRVTKLFVNDNNNNKSPVINSP